MPYPSWSLDIISFYTDLIVSSGTLIPNRTLLSRTNTPKLRSGYQPPRHRGWPRWAVRQHHAGPWGAREPSAVPAYIRQPSQWSRPYSKNVKIVAQCMEVLLSVLAIGPAWHCLTSGLGRSTPEVETNIQALVHALLNTRVSEMSSIPIDGLGL